MCVLPTEVAWQRFNVRTGFISILASNASRVTVEKSAEDGRRQSGGMASHLDPLFLGPSAGALTTLQVRDSRRPAGINSIQQEVSIYGGASWSNCHYLFIGARTGAQDVILSQMLPNFRLDLVVRVASRQQWFIRATDLPPLPPPLYLHLISQSKKELDFICYCYNRRPRSTVAPVWDAVFQLLFGCVSYWKIVGGLLTQHCVYLRWSSAVSLLVITQVFVLRRKVAGDLQNQPRGF